MQTMNQALAALHRRRLITVQQALDHSSNRDELEQLIKRGSAMRGGGGSQQPVSHPEAGVGVRSGITARR